MADVYRGSVCNIAAAASRSSQEGCFRTRDPQVIHPCVIKFSFTPPKVEECYTEYVLDETIEDLKDRTIRCSLEVGSFKRESWHLEPLIMEASMCFGLAKRHKHRRSVLNNNNPPSCRPNLTLLHSSSPPLLPRFHNKAESGYVDHMS